MLRLACALTNFGPQPTAEALQAIADAGLSALELPWPAPSAMPPAPWCREAQQHGLEVVSLAVEDGQDIETAMQQAAELNIPLLVAPANLAQLGSPPACCDAWRRLGDVAESLGLTVALRSGGPLCGDSREMAETMRRIGHRRVQLQFDYAQYVLDNEWSSAEVAMQRLFGWIACLRLRDTEGPGGSPGFPPIGQGGGVDFARLRQFLAAVRFGGPCVIEYAPRRSRNAAPEDRRAWLQQSVAWLRRCGWFEPLDCRL